ncbi:hypothetical protein Tco_0780775 [Tanacetum coccineum]
METQKPLLKDEDGEEVDVHLYRSMIGSLMYLTSSRSDIMFAVCACARYQVNPKVSYLYAVKRIFRYLKGQPKLGLWYPKDSPFDLVAYTDSDYARASLDRKSITGGCQFLRDSNEKKLIQMIKIHTDKNVADLLTKAFDFWDTVKAKTVNEEVQLQALVDKKKRKDTEVSQPSGPTKPMTDETENVESVPTHSNDPLLSGEDRLKLTELMNLCTNLQKKVLDFEKAKTSQYSEIASLKKRFKKLERRNNIDADEGVTLVNKTEGRNDEEMFDTVTTDSAITTTVDELTLAQTFIEIKAVKPKVRGVMIQRPSETTTTPIASKPSHDKGKAKITKLEKSLKKKDQIMYDQEVALNVQAQLQTELEEERLVRQKEEEANIALIESWDNTQAMMDADRLLAERLQAREQEELTDEDKAILYIEILEKRKKHFVALRLIEKRNKPPIQHNRKVYSIHDKGKHVVDLDIVLVRGKLMKIKQRWHKSIVDYKIIKEGKISIYQIIRADGRSKRHGFTRPEEGYERVLWGDPKIMFEHHVEDLVWSLDEIVGFKDRLVDDLELLLLSAAGTKVTIVSIEELMLLFPFRIYVSIYCFLAVIRLSTSRRFYYCEDLTLATNFSLEVLIASCDVVPQPVPFVERHFGLQKVHQSSID